MTSSPSRPPAWTPGRSSAWRSWHRWTAICLLAYIYLAVAVAMQRQQRRPAQAAPPGLPDAALPGLPDAARRVRVIEYEVPDPRGGDGTGEPIVLITTITDPR